MLGLYELKHILGDNEGDYHLSVQKYIFCEYCLLNSHMNEIQLQQKQ